MSMTMESKLAQEAVPQSVAMAVEFGGTVEPLLRVAYLPRGLCLSCLQFSQGISVLGLSCCQEYSADPGVQTLMF